MIDVAVIADPAAAEAALEPARARLLAQLTEPRSAAMLAAAVGLPRQKVNYHLRTLERHGLVELVEERRKGNMTERLLQAAAASYVISPSALAAVAPDPARAPDRLSARWLLALAAQLVRDVGDLITGADPGPEEARDVRDGRPGAVRVRRRSRRLHQRAGAGRDLAGGEVPRRAGRRRPRAPSRRRRPPGRHGRRVTARPTPPRQRRDRGDLMGHPFEQRTTGRGAGHPGRGLGRHRLRAGDRLLVHGPQRGAARRRRHGPHRLRRVRAGARRDRLGSGSPVRLPQRRGAGRPVHRL